MLKGERLAGGYPGQGGCRDNHMGLYALQSNHHLSRHMPGLAAHYGCALHAGAALYGDNPRLVTGRISALAYGVDVTDPYRAGMRGKTCVIDGKRCEHFLAKGLQHAGVPSRGCARHHLLSCRCCSYSRCSLFDKHGASLGGDA